MPLGVLNDSGLQRVDFGLPEDLCLPDVLRFQLTDGAQEPQAVIRAFRGPAQRSAAMSACWSRAAMAIASRICSSICWPSSMATSASSSVTRSSHARHLNALRCCDAYVSLHRAEGFGLGLAECMAMGKPVIATGWSGNMEFMDADSAGLVDFTLVPVREGNTRRGRGSAGPTRRCRWLQRGCAGWPMTRASPPSWGRQDAPASKQSYPPGRCQHLIERVRQLQANTYRAGHHADNEARGR